ncbi:MAG: hypothetical protein RBU35_20650 [Anaerolineae bacterium]|jgi:hypothetical protein|nr:hypothetical protein [Anaerolineae bacterium]
MRGDLGANQMYGQSPEEFLRRWPGAEELVELLGAVQDAVEAWEHGPGEESDKLLSLRMGLLKVRIDAMKGNPARRSNAR